MKCNHQLIWKSFLGPTLLLTYSLWTVAGSGGRKRMEMDSYVSVPPGFRFHPTEEELVGYYLRRKINSLKIDLDVIVEFDLYRMEPWDIQDKCKLGYEEQNEWYFFSHKDRKYPTGTRTNRATASGFWKATGRDKAVLSKEQIIGMRKTLVYYKGRAPNGRKSDWIMHEYRLQTSEHGPPQEEGWVVCRAFKKPSPSHKQGFEAWNNSCNIGNNSSNFRPMMKTFDPFNIGPNFHHQPPFPSQTGFFPSHSQMVDIPKLDSPSMCTSFTTNDNKFLGDEDMEDEKSSFVNDQYSDWKSFNKLLGSHQGTSSNSCSNMPLTNHNDEHLNSLLECLPHL